MIIYKLFIIFLSSSKQLFIFSLMVASAMTLPADPHTLSNLNCYLCPIYLRNKSLKNTSLVWCYCKVIWAKIVKFIFSTSHFLLFQSQL